MNVTKAQLKVTLSVQHSLAVLINSIFNMNNHFYCFIYENKRNN